MSPGDGRNNTIMALDNAGHAHKPAGSPGGTGGQFDRVNRSAPSGSLGGETTTTGDTLWADPDRYDAAHYEQPLTLAGWCPEDFGDRFAQGVLWSHRNGDTPEKVAAVRHYAGQMSDDDFMDLYSDIVDRFGDKEPGAYWKDDEARTLIGGKAELAFRNGDGTIAEDFLADPGEVKSGYMGGSAFTGYLAPETRSESQADVAKRIRSDIKAAKDAGYLPDKLKVSVRSARGSYSTGFRVVATIPDELAGTTCVPEWVQMDESRGPIKWTSPHNPRAPRTHPFATELRQRLSVVSNRYAETDNNSMVDYFHNYHEAHVSVVTNDPDAANKRYNDAYEKQLQLEREYALKNTPVTE